MSFKFITNSISTKSKVPTLSDIVKAAQTKQAMEKAASEAVHGVVKTASAAPVQPVQKEAGEKGKANPKNLTAPKFGPGGKKEEAAPVDAKAKAKAPAKAASVKVAEEKSEGESSGQPEAEAKLVNEPKMPEGDKGGKGGGSKSSGKDEAESSGQLDVEPLHQKGESTGEKPGSLETQKKGGEKSSSSQKTTKTAFKKVAELTPKQKEFLRKVWSLYWPKKFIDALLAD